jgi:DNA polymerase lambda
LEFHTNENNVFESLAYRKAIAQVKNAKEKITSCDQLKSFKYLGKSISNKVKEILLTGRLKKGEYVANDERVKSLKLLQSVWGIGMKQANNLYRKGIKSIEDLRKNENLLTASQKIGLKYYEDLITRIPRAEIVEIFKIIKEELLIILPEDQIKIEVCGSYRRGKSTCGDIDIIITRKDDDYIDGILQSLIDALMQRELIIEILQIGGNGNKYQFMGICRIGTNPSRRIDIKIYKKNNFPFALLYFTGSAYFNRSMRLFASKLGYQLSDFHLKKRNGDEEYIVCESEEDIFKALGIDFKTPEERDI